VAQTYGACERKAIDHLKRQGYEAFCPLLAYPSKRDITQFVESPLFPCYVFVSIAPGQRWNSINSTYGVVRLLTDRHRLSPTPLFVHDDKIADILLLSRTVEDPLPPGTLVRVRRRDSPFYDMTGTVMRMNKMMRVSVMMNIFVRDAVVEFVSPADLEKM
jgi:transcription antitermination factor NusG